MGVCVCVYLCVCRAVCVCVWYILPHSGVVCVIYSLILLVCAGDSVEGGDREVAATGGATKV